MLKIFLVILFSISFVSTSVFAEPSIEIRVSEDTINSLDTIVVTGSITSVAEYKPVKITVKDPNGNIVYAPLVPIEGDGEFRRVLQPTLPSFQAGTYTIIASHEDASVTAQAQFLVIAQEIPRNPMAQTIEKSGIIENKSPTSKITMSADAINGSDTITIQGNTSILDSDITLVASSPNGNVVTIAQISPDSIGNFEIEIKTAGPMWKQDGVYAITANQGAASEYKQTINVEIKDGVVIPEFGIIASVILAISILAVIIFSTRTKLNILTRY